MMLRARLSAMKLPLREVNIWEDSQAAARVRSVAAGNEAVPTVFVGKKAMVNPSVKEVLAAVRARNPELLPPERPRFRLSRLWSSRR